MVLAGLAYAEPAEAPGWSRTARTHAVRPGNFQSTRYRRQTVLSARPETPPVVGDLPALVLGYG